MDVILREDGVEIQTRYQEILVPFKQIAKLRAALLRMQNKEFHRRLIRESANVFELKVLVNKKGLMT